MPFTLATSRRIASRIRLECYALKDEHDERTKRTKRYERDNERGS